MPLADRLLYPVEARRQLSHVDPALFIQPTYAFLEQGGVGSRGLHHMLQDIFVIQSRSLLVLRSRLRLILRGGGVRDNLRSVIGVDWSVQIAGAKLSQVSPVVISKELLHA